MQIAERYEVNINFDDDHSSRLYIGESVGKNQAILSFHKQCPDEGIGYKIEWISSSVPGGGRSVVEAFCEFIGPFQSVCGEIIESKTWNLLSEIGMVQQALKETTPITFSPGSMDGTRQLKVWQMLTDGGLKDVVFTLKQGDGMVLTENGLEKVPLLLTFAANT